MKYILAVILFMCLMAMTPAPEQNIRITTLDVDENGHPWEDAYQLESAHYILRTNIPNAEGYTKIKGFEVLYQAFFAEFDSLISSDTVKAKLVVYYYNDYARYQQAMKGIHPNMVNSDGFYSSADKFAHLYRMKTKMPNALIPDEQSAFHECTHQLINIALGGQEQNTIRPHFWSVEGIACYFESLIVQSESYTIGESYPARFQELKWKKDQIKAIPLESFFQYTQEEFLSKGNPVNHYALAAGLTYFLCTTKGGAYKKNFLEYVVSINKGKGIQNSFDRIVGIHIQKLEQDFHQFLDNLR